MYAILTSGWRVEAEVEEKVGETGMANAKTGREDFFIVGSSVGSRPGDWSFLNETEFVGGQGVPIFVPGVGDEGVVERLEDIGWNSGRIGNGRGKEGLLSGVVYCVMVR